MALRLYPQLLALQQQHPQLSIELDAAPQQTILDGLQKGEIDLGLVTEEPGKGFASEQVGSVPLCLILPKRYAKIPITAESLTACGLVEHPDAQHYLAMYLDRCGDNILKALNIEALPSRGRVNQIGQILLPVAKGLGFTVLPESAVIAFDQRKQLHVHTPKRAVNESLYLVKKRHKPLPSRYGVVESVVKRVI